MHMSGKTAAERITADWRRTCQKADSERRNCWSEGARVDSSWRWSSSLDRRAPRPECQDDPRELARI